MYLVRPKALKVRLEDQSSSVSCFSSDDKPGLKVFLRMRNKVTSVIGHVTNRRCSRRRQLLHQKVLVWTGAWGDMELPKQSGESLNSACASGGKINGCFGRWFQKLSEPGKTGVVCRTDVKELLCVLSMNVWPSGLQLTYMSKHLKRS